MRMKKMGISVPIITAALLLAAPTFLQAGKPVGHGVAVVTILPKQHSELPPNVAQQDVSIKVDGKPTNVDSWVPLRGAEGGLELVLLIDGDVRNLEGSKFEETRHFILGLKPDVKVAIAYSQDGIARFSGPLTTDHAQVSQGLHMVAGARSSTYFSLSDLAKNWPSHQRRTRREVLLISDGIEPYSPRYDPENNYVQAAIHDAVRAGLVVYSIYWNHRGGLSNDMRTNSPIEDSGQNYLVTLTSATGGSSYGLGMSNPVSFQSYFDDLARCLDNQYLLGFSSPINGKPAFAGLKFKFKGFAAQVDAPQLVLVDPTSPAQ
jgi:hypothetical protein